MNEQSITYVVPYPPSQELFQQWEQGELPDDSVVHRFMDSLSRLKQGSVDGDVAIEILLHKNSGKEKKHKQFNPNFDAAQSVLLSALACHNIVQRDQVKNIAISKGRQMSGGKASIKITQLCT